MPEFVVAVYTWVAAHPVETLVYAFAVSGVASQLAAITPWQWDDRVSFGIGKALDVLAGAWGFAKPAPVEPAPLPPVNHVGMPAVYPVHEAPAPVAVEEAEEVRPIDQW